jgi:hypothetical protein
VFKQKGHSRMPRNRVTTTTKLSDIYEKRGSVSVVHISRV